MCLFIVPDPIDFVLVDDEDKIINVPVNERPTTNVTLSGVRLNSIIYMDNLNFKYKSLCQNNKIYIQYQNRKNLILAIATKLGSMSASTRQIYNTKKLEFFLEQHLLTADGTTL
ncbi:Hypothetical protein CINCED_3A016195 [Cinara cedri]|uniref:Uncharacterized protein n=1 Tax=Cinara cedri TaxID=506608 RepID=A0A5E4M6W4_9HEMI|nr:Hypothetical protein CINCED_3A016195 [Cinara cedri]